MVLTLITAYLQIVKTCEIGKGIIWNGAYIVVLQKSKKYKYIKEINRHSGEIIILCLTRS